MHSKPDVRRTRTPRMASSRPVRSSPSSFRRLRPLINIGDDSTIQYLKHADGLPCFLWRSVPRAVGSHPRVKGLWDPPSWILYRFSLLGSMDCGSRGKAVRCGELVHWIACIHAAENAICTKPARNPQGSGKGLLKIWETRVETWDLCPGFPIVLNCTAAF